MSERRRRDTRVVWVVAAVCVAAAVAGVVFGPYGVIVPRGFGGDPTAMDDAIVGSLRLPRVLGGALLGAALAVGGVLSQTVTRNPLSDPGLMGVSSGALLGGVIARGSWPQAETVLAWPCILGAVVATTVVLTIYQRLPHRTGTTLILVGVAVNAVLAGIVTVLTSADPQTFLALRLWLAGSVAGRTPSALQAASVLIIPALLAVWLLSRQLDVLQLGADRARSLGSHPLATTVVAVAAIAWLAGAATAFAGPVSFIGLAAPHLARALTRSHGHSLHLMASAALGAALVVAADTAGRAWAAPGEIPVSVVCAVLGAPVLIGIGLSRRTRKSTGDSAPA